MSQLFISHSSRDKDFVRRLALDLLDRDIAVWLDEWELAIGARLTETLKNAVDSSPHFLVVISQSFLQSDWTARELEWALQAETDLGREILIPIAIDGSDVPEPLADRIRADFSTSYSASFDALVDKLRPLASPSTGGLPSQELIPLFSEDGIHLDGSRLERRITGLRDRLPSDHVITPAQFRLTSEPIYVELRRRVFARLDNIKDDPYYTPEFAEQYRTYCEGVRRSETELLDRLADLLTCRGLRDTRGTNRVGETSRWYWRLARSHLLGTMSMLQVPGDGDDLGSEFRNGIRQVEVVYGTDDLGRVHVIPERGGYYAASIEKKSELWKKLAEYPGAVRDTLNHYEPAIVSKWILPQVLHYEQSFADWEDIDRCLVGMA